MKTIKNLQAATVCLSLIIALNPTDSTAQPTDLPFADCFTKAAKTYDINPRILVAIALTENAGFNPRATSPDGNDMGLMQINKEWIPRIAKYGIQQADLLDDPCANINVGAWILADSISRYGYNWTAIGYYNASHKNPRGRAAYIQRVQYNFEQAKRLVP